MSFKMENKFSKVTLVTVFMWRCGEKIQVSLYIIYLEMTVFYNLEAWDWGLVQLLIAFYMYSRRVSTEKESYSDGQSIGTGQTRDYT